MKKYRVYTGKIKDTMFCSVFERVNESDQWKFIYSSATPGIVGKFVYASISPGAVGLTIHLPTRIETWLKSEQKHYPEAQAEEFEAASPEEAIKRAFIYML